MIGTVCTLTSALIGGALMCWMLYAVWELTRAGWRLARVPMLQRSVARHELARRLTRGLQLRERQLTTNDPAKYLAAGTRHGVPMTIRVVGGEHGVAAAMEIITTLPEGVWREVTLRQRPSSPDTRHAPLGDPMLDTRLVCTHGRAQVLGLLDAQTRQAWYELLEPRRGLRIARIEARAGDLIARILLDPHDPHLSVSALHARSEALCRLTQRIGQRAVAHDEALLAARVQATDELITWREQSLRTLLTTSPQSPEADRLREALATDEAAPLTLRLLIEADSPHLLTHAARQALWTRAALELPTSHPEHAPRCEALVAALGPAALPDDAPAQLAAALLAPLARGCGEEVARAVIQAWLAHASDPWDRTRLWWALAGAPLTLDAEVMLAHMRDASDEEWETIREALQRGDAALEAALRDALHRHNPPALRVRQVEALGRVGGPDTIGFLHTLSAERSGPQLARAIAEVLRDLRAHYQEKIQPGRLTLHQQPAQAGELDLYTAGEVGGLAMHTTDDERADDEGADDERADVAQG